METSCDLELKVFTLPSCSICPLAKRIASEVAQKFGLAYKEVNMGTREGLEEAQPHQIMSVPSIVLKDEVLVRGRLISKEQLEEEVQKRLERWRARAKAEKG
jgi:glutaredoxin